MTDRYVVTLVIDIDHRLPVEIELQVIAFAETFHVLDAVEADLFFGRGHHLRYRRAFAAEANENQPVPDFAVERLEAVLLALELGKTVGFGDVPEAAVQVIGPAVKRADERLAAMPLFFRHDARSAMTANVVKSPNLALAVAHHDRAFVAHAEALVIPAAGQLGRVRDKQPAAQKDTIDL